MYLNLIQIAESFGVSESVVTDWVRKEGMPHVHDRGRILFERSQVMEWAAKHGLAAHTGFLSEPAPAQADTLALGPLLRRGGIWRDVLQTDLPQICDRIVGRLPGLPGPVQNMLVQRMCAPGGVNIAPVGSGFALPHPAMSVSLGEDCALVALILLKTPFTEADPPDGIPITRMLFFISPTPRLHVNMLGLLAKGITSGALQNLDAEMDDEAIFKVVEKGADTHKGLPR